MARYSIEPKTRKYVKGFGFLSFAKNLSDSFGKRNIGHCYKSKNRCCKLASKTCWQNLCDYSGAYIVLKGVITVEGTNANNQADTKLTFKNNAPFRSLISKINIEFGDNLEDLDILMPMYNFSEYSKKYSMISGRFWIHYTHKMNDDTNEKNTNNYRIDNKKTIANRSFDYKTKIIGKTPINNNTSKTKNFVQLKYLSNFWRSLVSLWVNVKYSLICYDWSTYSIICDISGTATVTVNPSSPARAETLKSRAWFQINSAKRYVPVATLHIISNIKFL